MSTKTQTTCDGCGDEIEAPGGLHVDITDSARAVMAGDALPKGPMKVHEIDVHGADCLIRWVQESRKIT